MIKYVFFDVANTLLFKPSIFTNIISILVEEGFMIDLESLIRNHKLLSEQIIFPDTTNENFYNKFNSELLLSIGVLPNNNILNKIFEACKYNDWVAYEDTKILSEIKVPIGIISNFNSGLRNKLQRHFGNINFNPIFVSEEEGIRKPSLEFYKKAFEKCNTEMESILYVGDSLKLDIIPARKLGIKALLIDRENIFVNSKYKINSLNKVLEIINKIG